VYEITRALKSLDISFDGKVSSRQRKERGKYG